MSCKKWTWTWRVKNKDQGITADLDPVMNAAALQVHDELLKLPLQQLGTEHQKIGSVRLNAENASRKALLCNLSHTSNNVLHNHHEAHAELYQVHFK